MRGLLEKPKVARGHLSRVLGKKGPTYGRVSWEHEKEYKGVNVIYLGGTENNLEILQYNPSYFTAKTPVSDIHLQDVIYIEFYMNGAQKLHISWSTSI